MYTKKYGRKPRNSSNGGNNNNNGDKPKWHAFLDYDNYYITLSEKYIKLKHVSHILAKRKLNVR